MPAPGSNHTAGEDGDEASIAMMQIDCEVTATKLLHIRESAVPDHMKEGAGSKREETGSKREEAGSKREEAGSKREEIERKREEVERKREEAERRNNGTQSGDWKRRGGSN